MRVFFSLSLHLARVPGFILYPHTRPIDTLKLRDYCCRCAISGSCRYRCETLIVVLVTFRFLFLSKMLCAFVFFFSKFIRSAWEPAISVCKIGSIHWWRLAGRGIVCKMPRRRFSVSVITRATETLDCVADAAAEQGRCNKCSLYRHRGFLRTHRFNSIVRDCSVFCM